MRTYKGIMMDRIDERNFRDKINKSIIKNWNIKYISGEELKRENERKQAQEIKRRLDETVALAEAKKREEIERLLWEREHPKKDSEDHETVQTNDAFVEEQIDRILSEKDEDLYRTIEAHSVRGEEHEATAEQAGLAESDTLPETEEAVESPEQKSAEEARS